MKKKTTYLKPDIIPECYLENDVLCVSPGQIEGVEIEEWNIASDN